MDRRHSTNDNTTRKTVQITAASYPASLQDADRPLGRWVERNGHKAQFHALCFLGQTWGAGPKRFSDDLAAEYTKYITSREGVVTWDVPIGASGQIPQEFIDQLKVIRQAVS